ncbi:ADP-ribosylglycohydrolase family protein [Natranaerofaba carboxydovora]|uniref:ADP-ribosylglycohydrolase family protein n=1 Tax=Natranaerofaba carboxydovora TaxID=2742683 RepID=UPI001F140CA0|nr:ADP-ribosylglycohydrolase family protein [Natranaerofaba carboxydovora]UMZ74468.1 ADP-ribosylglycohydrolase [Natranaerofaba carboxydovora]
MWGAICGDIIGSTYEGNPVKSEEIDLFPMGSVYTDDSVLTVAVADAILNDINYAKKLKEYGRKYPNAGYGGNFMRWIFSDSYEPYGSFGNGSAMRVSPVGFAYDNLEKVNEEAKKSSAATHDHPEGIKGAQATAAAVYLARNNHDKSEIKEYITNNFSYDLERCVEEIRPGYSFDVTCQGSVPESIICFLESKDLEDAIRKGISLGGDSDTIACIAGSIAYAYYNEVPESILTKVKEKLDSHLLKVIEEFNTKIIKS